MSSVDKVLEDALLLPLDERVRVAEELLASLDAREEDVERAWAVEIARRASEVRDGGPSGEEWREVLRRIQADILRR